MGLLGSGDFWSYCADHCGYIITGNSEECGRKWEFGSKRLEPNLVDADDASEKRGV